MKSTVTWRHFEFCCLKFCQISMTIFLYLFKLLKGRSKAWLNRLAPPEKSIQYPIRSLNLTPSFQRPLQQPLRQQIFYPIFKAPYFSHMSEVNLDNAIDPLTSRCDSCITSPSNIHTLFGEQVMRILKLIRWEFFSWSNIKFSQPISVENV